MSVENSERRINIGPIARKLAREGVPADQLHLNVPHAYLPDAPTPLPTEDEYLWQDWSDESSDPFYKELFAVSAVIIDRIVDYALEIRSSLPPKPPSRRTNSSLRAQDNMAMILKRAVATRRVALNKAVRENDFTDPLTSVYKRYKFLLDDPRALVPDGPFNRIETGLMNGLQTMDDVIYDIPPVYGLTHPEDIPNLDRLMGIARRSYVLVNKLAGYKLQKAGWIGMAWAKVGYSSLKLVGNPEEDYLDLNMEALENYPFRFDYFEDLNVRQGTVIGCPARINFGDGSAIKKLWDWRLEIAELQYKNWLSKILST